VLIAPARTYDTLDNAPVGGVYFSFSKYQVMVEQQLELTPGADPARNAPPRAFLRKAEYSLATFNVENLYDFRDDPFDGCDFTGNPGCPGVNPPFDYVPASDAAYQARLAEIAQQIAGDLHAPDLILVQEAEDQDICTVTGGALTCGTTNDADGKPDTLQELATAIAALGGPAYDAAYDRDGADDRGIVSGFLYRTDRVELLPPLADDPVLGSAPTVDYRGTALSYNTDVQNPKALNADLPDDVDLSTGVDGSNVFTRPPQVGLFRIWRNDIGFSVFTDLYAFSNHFSSTPNARVGQRTEQALYNAEIVAALQASDPGVRVVVGGDLNVYPRPDDPFVPGDALFPSDQLAPIYDQGLTNLFDVLVGEIPVSAYGYIFQGQTQTLDQIFVTDTMLVDLTVFRAAHINSDFPADYDGDGPRGTSDHDPQVARYDGLPSLDKLEDLVFYYDANGAITGNNTTHILIDRLERARRFLERGQKVAYRAQLVAFILQVRGFTPRFITPAASTALVHETTLLLARH
jgi:predicted extracellular nuclease